MPERRETEDGEPAPGSASGEPKRLAISTLVASGASVFLDLASRQDDTRAVERAGRLGLLDPVGSAGATPADDEGRRSAERA
jgi:hypothetical protein